MSDEPALFSDSIQRMFRTLWPKQKYPGADEASLLIEDYLTSAVEWQAKIEHAHDMIRAVARNRNAYHLMPALRRGLDDALDTLCWVLGHQKNKAFETTLSLVESVLLAVGAEVPQLKEPLA